MPLSLLPIFLGLEAASRMPNCTTQELVADIETRCPSAIGNTRIKDVVEEILRAKGGELHNISALTGGMVAQEIIKVITKQYIPVDNTCIFDGIQSRTQILRT